MKKILSLGLSLISVLTMAISTTGCSVADWSKQLFCEHVYDEGEITKESTCTEVGILAKTCTLCGKVEEEEIEKLPHVELYVERKDATCKESGLTDYVKCKVCDTVLVEPSVIPVLGHRVVEDKEVKATCLANGLTKGEHCEVCGEVFVKQETVLASGHSLVVLEGKPATCKESGLTNGVKCENCNVVFTEQEEIPKKEHVDSNLDLLCDNCASYLNLAREEVLAQGDDLLTGNWFRIYRQTDGNGNFVRFNSVPSNVEIESEYSLFEANIGFSSSDLSFYFSFFSMETTAYLKGLLCYEGNGFVDFYIENKTYELESGGEVVGSITFTENSSIYSDFSQSENLQIKLYKLV